MIVTNFKKFSLNSIITNRRTQTVMHNWKDHYQHKLKIHRKLSNLYNGSIPLPDNDDSFLNLSDYKLTQPQNDFLKLGPTSHLFKGFNHVQKLTDFEILYQNILKLQKQNQVKTKPQLRDLLKAEATKNRSKNKHKYSTVLTWQQKNAAEQLHKHPDITIKEADKTNIYIALNKSDYHSKLEIILNDKNKFTRLNPYPTNQLKSIINKLINANNADLHNIKLPKIIGDYKPGYIYWTVNIHKPGYPLQPIISQVTTPTYQLTKTINHLITP